MALDVTIGGLDSNSYVTVEYADSYISAHLDADDWSELTTPQKELLLRKAALFIEEFKFGGDRTVLGQSLAFPRINLYRFEDAKLPVNSNGVPTPIKDVQCELALWMFNSRGVDEFSSVNMAGLSVSKGMNGDSNSNSVPEIVFVLIKPYLKNTVNTSMVSVSRAYPTDGTSTSASSSTAPTLVSGVTVFTGLLDVPNSYTDSENKFVKVKSDASGLEFSESSSTTSWGAVTGTLSNQTDLNSALAGKSATSHTHTDLHTHTNKSTLDVITSVGGGTQYLADDGTYKSIIAQGGSWGTITGTLSDQLDLQVQLNDLHTHTNKTLLDSIIDTGTGTTYLGDDGEYHALDGGHDHTNKTLLDSITSTGDGATFLASDGTYKAVTTGSATWGEIVGTLSNQTDLNSALAGKSATGHTHTDLHTHTNKTALDVVTAAGSSSQFLAGDGTYKTVPTSTAWGAVTGTLSDQTDLNSALAGKSATSHTHTELHEHTNSSLLASITSAGDGASYLANDGTYKAVSGGSSDPSFTASGSITAGSVVALNADGTVSIISGTADSVSSGSAVVVRSAETDYTRLRKLSDTTFIVATTAISGTSGSAYIGTISGTTISYGTPVTITGASTLSFLDVAVLSSTLVVFSYIDASDSSKGAYVTGHISGTTITLGTEYNTLTSYSGILHRVAPLTSTTFVATYKTATAYVANIGTVSGSSISMTMGNAVSITTSTPDEPFLLQLSASSFVIGYVDSSRNGLVRTGTVSGTTITLNATTTTWQTGNTYYSNIVALSYNKIVCASRSGGSPYTGKAYVGIADTSGVFTFGTGYDYASTGDYQPALTKISSNIFAVMYRSTPSYTAYMRVGYISLGNVIAYNAQFTSVANAKKLSSDFIGGRVVSTYTDANNYASSVSINPSLSNINSRIGIAQSTVSTGATVSVKMFGSGIDTNQAGLIIGEDYYIQSSGILYNIPTAYKVGTAITTTSLYLNV